MSKKTDLFIQSKDSGINIKATFNNKITFLVEGGKDKEFYFKHINNLINPHNFIITPCNGKDKALNEYKKFLISNHGRNKGNTFLIIDRDLDNYLYHSNCDNIDECSNCSDVRYYNDQLNCTNIFVTTGYSYENKIFHSDNLLIYFNYQFNSDCEETRDHFIVEFENFLSDIKDYIILYKFLSQNHCDADFVRIIKNEINKVQYPYTDKIRIDNVDPYLESDEFLNFRKNFEENNMQLYNEFNGKILVKFLRMYMENSLNERHTISYNNIKPLERFNKFIKNIKSRLINERNDLPNSFS